MDRNLGSWLSGPLFGIAPPERVFEANWNRRCLILVGLFRCVAVRDIGRTIVLTCWRNFTVFSDRT